MADALKVEFKLLGIDQAMQDMKRMADSMQQFGRGSSGVGGIGGTGSGSAISQERQLASLTKIRQDAQLRNERQLARERATRIRQETQEAKQAQNEARARFKTLTNNDTGGNGLASGISRVIRSSRIGIGGNGIEWMPLVSSFEGLMGKFAGPVGIAVAALSALDQAARHYADTLAEMRTAQNIGGGTAAETAYGRVIGGYSGQDAKDVANQARAFGANISGGGEASAYAGRYGIYDNPGAAGAVDKMTNYVKWIDKLRAMSPEEATRAARATGTDSALDYRGISDPAWQQMKEQAARSASQFTPEALGREATERARDAAGQQEINDKLSRMAYNFWHSGEGLLPGGGERTQDERIQRDNAEYARRQQGQEQHTSALQQNTDALNALHHLLRPGTYGGGERTAGAIPGAFVGAGWQNKQLRAQAHALGAFAL